MRNFGYFFPRFLLKMEVEAELQSEGIFLSGDRLSCAVTFKNVNESDSENLAWASAQIQCLCQLVKNPSNSRRDSESVSPGGNATLTPSSSAASNIGTSLQPARDAHLHEVVSTSPKILFCDLTLKKGVSKTYLFEETLPANTPSTYHGRNIKYTHRVVVAAQRVNCNIATLKVPFRVLSVQTLTSPPDLEAGADQKQQNPAITNPFVSKDGSSCGEGSEAKSSWLRQSWLPLLQEPSARRISTFFDIKNTRGRVARLCLFKTSYRLGEDVMGLFDFSSADAQCMQYAVSLYCEERILDSTNSKAKVLSRQSCQEFCFGYDESNFVLPIPLHATPSFSDFTCSLSWMLRFEFVICSGQAEPIQMQPALPETAQVGHEWNGPAHVPVETMTWNLPIVVLPTHPKQVAHVIQMPTRFSITM